MVALDQMISGFIRFDGLAALFEKTVKGYSLEDPFTGGEIMVKVNKLPADANDRTFIGKTKEIMAIDGNKPFNALLALWLHTLGASEETSKDFDKYIKFFKFEQSSDYNQEQYIFNCKALLFGHMLLMTRGSIPSINEHGKNPLPRLMATNLGYGEKATEGEFAKAYAGFDIRKVKFVEFLKIPFSSFPDAIKNRMLKGTAGSRVLKLFAIASTYGNAASEDPDNVKIFQALCEISGQGKCYLNLHPLRQTVQSSVPGFYPACVGLIAENLGKKRWDIFLQECMTIPTFSKDVALGGVAFTDTGVQVNGTAYKNAFKTVTPDALKLLFGKSVSVE